MSYSIVDLDSIVSDSETLNQMPITHATMTFPVVYVYKILPYKLDIPIAYGYKIPYMNMFATVPSQPSSDKCYTPYTITQNEIF
tara:strand:+ start:47 stop:298 length:252 start_codon:yes stop_codon:yes gene_type:complete